jgi:hypothetical protein
MWTPEVGPNVYTSLFIVHKQECDRVQAVASHFGITVEVYILLIVGIILHFYYVFRNTQ